jgi:hypothetical protein
MGSAQERYMELLMSRVREDRYPSGELLDRIEASLDTPEQIVEYVEMIFEKAESARYPSKELLNRIHRFAALL